MTKRYNAGDVITAMVTPFNKDGKVDYSKVEKLAKHLMLNGSDAILVTATTGECPTLIHEEEVEILSTVKRAVENKIPVIFGAGSNSTETAVKMTKIGENRKKITTFVPVNRHVIFAYD